MATKLITPEAILSYPHLHEAKEDDNGKFKFSATLIFPKGTDLSALHAAALEAAVEKFGKTYKVGGKQVPIEEALRTGALRSPFRYDAEKKGYPEGSCFINIRTEQRPGLVGPTKDPVTGKPVLVTDAEKIKAMFYPGAIVRASIAAFGYAAKGNTGVSFALNNMQKLREGERIDGRVAAESEFDAVMTEEPADLNDLT